MFLTVIWSADKHPLSPLLWIASEGCERKFYFYHSVKINIFTVVTTPFLLGYFQTVLRFNATAKLLRGSFFSCTHGKSLQSLKPLPCIYQQWHYLFYCDKCWSWRRFSLFPFSVPQFCFILCTPEGHELQASDTSSGTVHKLDKKYHERESQNKVLIHLRYTM